MINYVPKYLNRNYKYPACYALITDFYIEVLKFPMAVLNIEGKTKTQLQEAFGRAIYINKYFKEQSEPIDGDLILLFKHKNAIRPDHCGIYIKNSVLHASQTMPVFEALHTLMGRYEKKTFMRLRDAY